MNRPELLSSDRDREMALIVGLMLECHARETDFRRSQDVVSQCSYPSLGGARLDIPVVDYRYGEKSLIEDQKLIINGLLLHVNGIPTVYNDMHAGGRPASTVLIEYKGLSGEDLSTHLWRRIEKPHEDWPVSITLLDKLKARYIEKQISTNSLLDHLPYK